MEKARANFWNKIYAVINEAKSCKSDAKRDSEEIRRERELMDMDLEWRFNYLLVGWKYISQRLRSSERERDNTSYRA